MAIDDRKLLHDFVATSATDDAVERAMAGDVEAAAWLRQMRPDEQYPSLEIDEHKWGFSDEMDTDILELSV